MNNGAHRVDGTVETRGSEASADKRCLIIGIGSMQCPVGRIATARHGNVKMRLYCELGSTAVTQGTTRQAGLQDPVYVIARYAVA
jgi:hypothetical protein